MHVYTDRLLGVRTMYNVQYTEYSTSYGVIFWLHTLEYTRIYLYLFCIPPPTCGAPVWVSIREFGKQMVSSLSYFLIIPIYIYIYIGRHLYILQHEIYTYYTYLYVLYMYEWWEMKVFVKWSTMWKTNPICLQKALTSSHNFFYLNNVHMYNVYTLTDEYTR